MTETATPTRIDVREMPPAGRHPAISRAFRTLAANEAMELVNDHDPRPLFYQFQAEAPGQFSWDYLERGPDTWRVRITRLAKTHGNGQCCGSCGGT